jgi:hypothetical protein
MVKIHVKYEDKSEFWLETQTSIQVADLSRDINVIYKNKRLLLDLMGAVQDLIQHAATPEIPEATVPERQKAAGPEVTAPEVNPQVELSEEGRDVLERTVAEIQSRLDGESITAEGMRSKNSTFVTYLIL